MTFKQKLKDVLLKDDFLALTTDMWKNKLDEYFLGLTVHFFDEDLNYHSLLFGFRKFTQLHFAVNSIIQ